MKKFFIGTLILTFFFPLAYAAAVTFPGSGGTTFPGAGAPSSQSSGGNFSSFQLTNPLKVSTVCGLIKSVLQALLVIGLPIAVLFLIFAGLKYVAALGKPEKISEANSNLLWTVIGIAIFLGAALIAQVIATTITNISAQSGAGFQNISSCN